MTEENIKERLWMMAMETPCNHLGKAIEAEAKYLANKFCEKELELRLAFVCSGLFVFIVLAVMFWKPI